MTLGAAEALPLVLSLSFAVTWLQVATLKRSRRASPTLKVVSKLSSDTTSKTRPVETGEVAMAKTNTVGARRER